MQGREAIIRLKKANRFIRNREKTLKVAKLTIWNIFKGIKCSKSYKGLEDK